MSRARISIYERYERLWVGPPRLTWNDILDAELALIRGEPVPLETCARLLAEVKARRRDL